MKQIWTKSTLSVHRLYSKWLPLARTHARCYPRHWSTVSSKIDCSRPHQTSMSRRCNSSTLWILSVADTMLRDSPDLVIHKTKIWAVWRPQCWTQESLAFLDAAVQLLHVRSAVCRCTVLLEQSCYQHTLRDAGSSMTSLWRHEAAVRDITIISCFVTTMKLLHALQIYPSFCEEVYAVTVFKLVQRQTIGKVRNSTMRFWTNNFCLQKWKNY